MNTPHILLFDLLEGGHHGQYIRQLIEYWSVHQIPCKLTVAAPKSFFARHPDVTTIAHQTGATCFRSEAISRMGYWGMRHEHGRILKLVVEAVQPTHVLCMYFDQVQFSLAWGLRYKKQLLTSGIYFRPNFHYKRVSFSKERVSRWLKRQVLHFALKNPLFDTLFCLDPYVIPYIKDGNANIVHLPDGIPESTPYLNSGIKIPHARRVALFFGSIAARKGIFKLLSSLPLLPEDQQKKLALLIVGKAISEDSDRVKSQIELCRAQTHVEIIHIDRFVDEDEISSFFMAADLALLPYQQHVGSSGVLVRAASEGIPVLGSDYGLIRRNIETHRLGLTIDSTNAGAISKGLERWLDGGIISFEIQKAKAFGAANTASQFCSTIFSTLLRNSTN